MDKHHRTYDHAYSAQPSVFDQHFKTLSTSDKQELDQALLSIMNNCAVNHIEAGKNWVFKNCQRPEQCQAVLDHMNSLATCSSHFSQRLHFLYLINDILHHVIRRKLNWMKSAFLSRVATLLHLAYTCPGGNQTEQHQKVSRVIDLWDEKRYFDSGVIQQLRYEMNHGPTTTMDIPPTIPKPYYELPAGLMTVALKINQPPYTPIDPSSVREKPSHRKHPSKEMQHAIDDYYAGLKLDPINTPSSTSMFSIGWESHYLDSFYKTFHERHEQRTSSRHTSRSTSRERRRSHYRSRSRSPRRSDRHHRSESRSSSNERRYEGQQESSHRRYPVSSPPPRTSSRMGLGHDSAPTDVFDEFRKRSSYNFIKEVGRRDIAAGPKCYNCGKYGHFAKNCEAHLGKQ
ncbi:hypothetical protein BC941DRAFT_436669 [Chlamydoabsidia padenii]|nr:hypothetical protein BC941DRAFT_436669 [Chlamydoabsidia padenii]